MMNERSFFLEETTVDKVQNTQEDDNSADCFQSMSPWLHFKAYICIDKFSKGSFHVFRQFLQKFKCLIQQLVLFFIMLQLMISFFKKHKFFVWTYLIFHKFL